MQCTLYSSITFIATKIPNISCKSANKNSEGNLEGVLVEVVIADETGDELTEKEVVRVVDRSETPVSVVVGIAAGTKRTPWRMKFKHQRRPKGLELS